MKYQERYGDWAGNPRGHAPDFTRCAANIWPNERGPAPHQCHKKAICDPDETGKPTTCKIHSEAYAAEKSRIANEKYEASMAKFRVRANAQAYHDALVQIANGHNDPRGLASEVLGKGKQ